MTLLDVALDCIRRGWYVLPCVPKDKTPLISGAYKSASNREVQVRAWWGRWPNANVGIAPGKSGLAILDVDHGNKTVDEVRAWMTERNIPASLTVRTGRRVNKDTGEPECGVQVYYAADGSVDTFPWLDGSHGGEVRCASGHVMAAGSIHPDSGEEYSVLIDAPVVPLPDVVRRLPRGVLAGKPGSPNAAVTWDGVSKITDHRNMTMISILGRLRAGGADDAGDCGARGAHQY